MLRLDTFGGALGIALITFGILILVAQAACLLDGYCGP